MLGGLRSRVCGRTRPYSYVTLLYTLRTPSEVICRGSCHCNILNGATSKTAICTPTRVLIGGLRTQPEPETCGEVLHTCMIPRTCRRLMSNVTCPSSLDPAQTLRLSLRLCPLTPRRVGRPHRRFFFGSSSFLLAWSSSTSAMAATAPVTYRSGCGSMPRLRVPCLGSGLGLGLGLGVG